MMTTSTSAEANYDECYDADGNAYPFGRCDECGTPCVEQVGTRHSCPARIENDRPTNLYGYGDSPMGE